MVSAVRMCCNNSDVESVLCVGSKWIKQSKGSMKGEKKMEKLFKKKKLLESKK